ncbi:MAG: gliding motility protein GldM [Prevotellaceae bacterium]|jgi:gliding motility-associated protein GldM|nr:gliding motility protein GldM [Prevotellaceae bacterium]
MAGGNLTPRQRMINMMYLVLTAMLALNVSAEVLDAFVKIEVGLQQTSAISQAKNEQTLKNFANAAVENKTRVEKWQEKAIKLEEKTKALTEYIQNLKIELIKVSDGEDAKAIVDGKIVPEAINAKDKTDGVNTILIGPTNNGKAYDLKKMIEDYKGFIFTETLKEKPAQGLVDEVNGLLNFNVNTGGADGRTWETFTFEGMPLMSAVAMLTKIEVDVRNSASSVYDYLFKQIDASTYKFSGLSAIVRSNKASIIRGEDIEAEIYLGAYDPTISFTANLNIGKFNSDGGMIKIKRRGDGIGVQNINGNLTFKGPEGTMESIPVKFEYQVVETGLVVSPDKMNVFYRGIDNPVSISVAGVDMKDISINISNATFNRDASGTWQVKPGTQNECSVIANFNGQSLTRKFRVKNVPPPTPEVDGIKAKVASKNELAAAQGLRARMPLDFEFDVKYSITSFNVAASIGGYYSEEAGTGAGFNSRQRGLIDKVRSGDFVMFTGIKAQGPSGSFDLNDLVIKVR